MLTMLSPLKVAKVEDKLKALEKENEELKAFMQERVAPLERIVTSARESIRPPPEGEKRTSYNYYPKYSSLSPRIWLI